MMKKFDVTMLTIAILVVGLVILGVAGKQETQEPAVAIVNGEAITKDRVINGFTPKGQQKVMENAIKEIVIRQEAKKLGVQVDQKAIDAEVEQIKKSWGTKEEFEEFLKRKKITEADMRKDLEMSELSEKAFATSIPLKDEEIKKYFEQHKSEFGDNAVYENVKDKVKEKAMSEHKKEFFDQWIHTLVKNADIKYISKIEQPVFEEDEKK
ncbi:hypothetical protein AYJ08_02215 [Brevibacillus sp. SKDU10]|uniref:SurA N-terminal domain-containing protein n=1 Tax=Brevibacillus sp. SKDU10 TaxID=1247872 RepID=UPI0007C96193|nr:SurA N-terminal domain-containing protein [Brevibacillus sp. SKDU10]OAJ72403.1 hypothetical protein AYJ08_02215 [Brevibacillus sp. SKDU10]